MAPTSIWLTRSQTIGAQPGVIHPPNEDYAIIGKPAADIAKSLTKDWHPKLKPLFDNMNEAEAAFWKITCSTPYVFHPHTLWSTQLALHTSTPLHGVAQPSVIASL